METAEAWRSLFEQWPDSLPRQGLVVTVFQETIPFINFLISGALIMLERDKPDTYGARKVMLTYEAISAVKITSPMELERFQVLGFQSPK
jgi:hypothetical protein